MQAGDFDSSDEEAAEEDLRPLPISWLSLSPFYSSESLGLCSLPGKKHSLKFTGMFGAEER
uniref:protein-tyrosine-phosphatase n=1 Tax=Aquila chrysaetos chrysaetos TaxID=223781 RepID=A0A663E1X4_AQUCH